VRRRHLSPGLGLITGGLALEAWYVVVIWYGVFSNDTTEQVCGPGVPHRDNFFPPYTACGSGPGQRVTSTFAEYAGATLFVLAAAILVSGVTVMIAGRYRQAKQLR
jgi:hypothetical protein